MTRIKVILPSRSHNVDDTDLVIRVPAASRLSVNTVSADIKVQGVTGAQRLQSVSADIHTEAGGEDVECKTVSGDVTVDGSGKKGLLTITTVSGDATALKVAGEVNANTVSGDLVLGLGETNRSRAALDERRPDAGNASRERRQARRREHLAATCGSNLVGAVDAEFDVSSFSGDIRNCFGPKAGLAQRVRPGQGTALPRRPGDRPGPHQDAERRRQRLQEVTRRARARRGIVDNTPTTEHRRRRLVS